MPSDSWDDYAADWDNEADVRLYAENAYDSLQRRIAPLFENLAETSVLDFGCGTGLLTERLAPLCKRVVAVDSSGAMIEVLNQKVLDTGIDNVSTLVTTIDADAIVHHSEALGNFDLVLASSVCSFLPDYEKTLCDITTTMKRGGVFVQWDWIDDMPAARIRNAFTGCGLEVVEIGPDFSMESEKGSFAVVIGVGELSAGA